MNPSFSDVDRTSAHDEPESRPHPTRVELVIGSLLGAVVAAGILSWLLGVA